MSFSLDLSNPNGSQAQSLNTEPAAPGLNFLNFVGKYGVTGSEDFRADVVNNNHEMKAAVAGGFIYDKNGKRFTDIDRLRGYLGPDTGNTPLLYFRDPNDQSPYLHHMNKDGTVSSAHHVSLLIGDSNSVRTEQYTQPKFARKTSFLEKLGRFFTLGLWKPARFRQQERSEAVRNVERMKTAEAMGYQIDPRLKRKYKDIWDLADNEKAMYINGSSARERAKATVSEEDLASYMQSENKKPTVNNEQSLLETLSNEAKQAYERINNAGYEKDFPEGVKRIQSYLKNCQENPRKEQRTAVNKLMSGKDLGDLLQALNEKGNVNKFTDEQLETLLNVEGTNLFMVGYAISKENIGNDVWRKEYLRKCEKFPAAKKIIMDHHGLKPSGKSAGQKVGQKEQNVEHKGEMIIKKGD